MTAFLKWCASNTTSAKVTRTIAQGIISVLLVMVPTWAGQALPAQVATALVPCIMALLSAAQSWLGARGTYLDEGSTE